MLAFVWMNQLRDAAGTCYLASFKEGCHYLEWTVVSSCLFQEAEEKRNLITKLDGSAAAVAGG